MIHALVLLVARRPTPLDVIPTFATTGGGQQRKESDNFVRTRLGIQTRADYTYVPWGATMTE